MVSACYTLLVKMRAHSRQCARLLRLRRLQVAAICLLAAFAMSCAEPAYNNQSDGKVSTTASVDADKTDAAPQGPMTGDASVGQTRDAEPAEASGLRPAPTSDAAISPLSPDPGPVDATSLQGADAGTQWWARLKTIYALRIRFFGRDRALGEAASFKHEIIALAHLSVDETGRVAMQTQRCRDHGALNGLGGLTDDFHWLYPERLAPEHFELVLRDGKVQTSAAPRTLGYQATSPAECKPGASLASRPDQVWIADGKCTCGAEPLPMFATDCRVTDADADEQPGFSVQHTGFEERVEGARTTDSSQIVNGVLSADGRIQGSFIENYNFLGLSCGTSACLHNDILVCPLEQNPVQFEPLPDNSPAGAAWDCSSVLDQADQGRFFTNEMFTFPSGC